MAKIQNETAYKAAMERIEELLPLVDENTRLRMEEGPEYKIPHFYADYDLIKELFKDFKIIFINHIEDFYESNDKTYSSFHYHVLIKKVD